MKSTLIICIFVFFLFNCEDAENSIAAVQNNCGLETTFVQVVDSLKWPKGNDIVLADDCGYVGVGRLSSRPWIIKFNEEGYVEWESIFSPLQISEDDYDWAGEDIDLTDDGGAIIAVDNGQFGFLRIENVQNPLDIHNEKLVTENFCLLYTSPSPRDP